jgi:hypothetical protein
VEVVEAASVAAVLVVSAEAALAEAVPEEAGKMNIMRNALAILFIFFVANSCTQVLTKRYCTLEDVVYYSLEDGKNAYAKGPCEQSENYIPDTNYLDHHPIKYIRVNFHWINTSDSSKNYVGKEAVEFTKGLLKASNYDLAKNNQMWLPHNNNTPNLPLRFRYVLAPRPDDPDDDGIYFHYDDEIPFYVSKGKNNTLFDRSMEKKYAIQKDTVLNIFVIPHHPDSVRSTTYNAVGTGVALGSMVKIAGMYEDQGSFWNYRGCFNHEIGHIYSLSHTWKYNDGCDDTPRHKQECFSKNQRPGCDSLASNNVMDYNAMQNAWSPCQIGRVRHRMSRVGSRQRNYLVPNWCELNEDQHIYIRDSVVWNCHKDLEGHVTIETGGHLIMSCRVSVPKDGKITVQPGAKLTLNNTRLHNSCGDEWEGIEIQEQGELKGEVVFIGDPKLENVKNPLN